MRTRLTLLVVASALACKEPARAQPNRLAPIPANEAVSTHGPYGMGACGTCHQTDDPDDPGPAAKVSDDLCFDCHDEFKGKAVRMDRSVHPKGGGLCTTCHNPHNSRKTKLRL